jgi:hypothetical protein
MSPDLIRAHLDTPAASAAGAYVPGLCYGSSDVPLGADGLAMLPSLVDEILAVGTLRGLPVSDWTKLIRRTGGIVSV